MAETKRDLTPGAFCITGEVAALYWGIKTPVNGESYYISGKDVNMGLSHGIGAGAYEVTGLPVDLMKLFPVQLIEEKKSPNSESENGLHLLGARFVTIGNKVYIIAGGEQDLIYTGHYFTGEVLRLYINQRQTITATINKRIWAQ